MLKLPGKITHVQTNHETGTVDIFFEGDGQMQVAEGQESVVKSIQDWLEYNSDHLEEELINQWESD